MGIAMKKAIIRLCDERGTNQMSKPRGHSNVAGDARPDNEWARIPITGGADVSTVRPLPPLYLSEQEWQVIGRIMGWTLDAGMKGE